MIPRGVLVQGVIRGAAPLAFLLLAFLLTGCRGKGSRSLLIITIDTLRADHLSCYRPAAATSPNLDRLFARGTRFEWALSAAPSTAPSHASILTGRYPSFHSVGLTNGMYSLAPGEVTLAEMCAAQGMTTIAVVSNPVLGRYLGLDQGFDVYDDNLQGKEANRDMPDQIARVTVDKTLARIDRLLDGPFFLWVHFQDPHGPYTPPGWKGTGGGGGAGGASASTDELPVARDDVGFESIPAYQAMPGERRPAQYVARYDGEIRYLDGQIARLLGAMEEAGLLRRTLIAVTADHGEALGEEGFYFAHGHSLSLEQVRVPLAFVGPGIPAGRVLEGPVSNLDIFATAAEFLGLDPPPGTSSRSLLSLMAEEGTGGGAPGPIYAESVTQRAVLDEGLYLRWHRVRMPDPSTLPPPRGPGYTDYRRIHLGEGILNLETGERWAATARPDLIRLLQGFHRRAEASLRSMAAGGGAGGGRRRKTNLSREQIERLRALGYSR